MGRVMSLSKESGFCFLQYATPEMDLENMPGLLPGRVFRMDKETGRFTNGLIALKLIYRKHTYSSIYVHSGGLIHLRDDVRLPPLNVKVQTDSKCGMETALLILVIRLGNQCHLLFHWNHRALSLQRERVGRL